MTKLTNAIINKIGTNYYERHPIEEKPSDKNRFSSVKHSVVTFFKKQMHDNHGFADELKAYGNEIKDPDEDSTEQAKWLFLLNIYARLPKDGELSTEIEQLVQARFDIPTITRSLPNGFGGFRPLKPVDIAPTLEAMVKSHFLLPIQMQAVADNTLNLSPCVRNSQR